MFMAVGHALQRLTSTDGENWSKPQLGDALICLYRVCYAKGRFVAVGFGLCADYTGCSTDGVSWKTQRIECECRMFMRDVVFAK